MNSNDAIEGTYESGHWHEKLLSFQNASVYLQLLNSRFATKSGEPEQEELGTEDVAPSAKSVVRPDA